MKLSKTLERVIALAGSIRHYWETELPKRHPDYPIMNPGEQPVAAPPEIRKLAKLLARLPDDMVYQVRLVMDLGRGYFDVRDLAEYYRTLREEFDSAASLASQLSGSVTLAGYLQDGQAELEKHHIDVDRLPLTPARVHRS
jgi:hypothetical protein